MLLPSPFFALTLATIKTRDNRRGFITRSFLVDILVSKKQKSTNKGKYIAQVDLRVNYSGKGLDFIIVQTPKCACACSNARARARARTRECEALFETMCRSVSHKHEADHEKHCYVCNDTALLNQGRAYFTRLATLSCIEGGLVCLLLNSERPVKENEWNGKKTKNESSEIRK